MCLRNKNTVEISEEQILHGSKSHIDIMEQADERIEIMYQNDAIIYET